MVKHQLDSKQLHAFVSNYDISHQDIAEQARGRFLNDFPLQALQNIELDDYVIGLQKPTFCDQVEAKTRPWANIRCIYAPDCFVADTTFRVDSGSATMQFLWGCPYVVRQAIARGAGQ